MTRRSHIVLLGDSIFDNAAYTGGAPDVATHLRRLLPTGSNATLCAVDGATTRDVQRQLGRVPHDATHLVISVGGNDALQNLDLLSLRVASSAEAFETFAARVLIFERAYREAIRLALGPGLPTIVCTIYNAALDPTIATAARLGLALFNDAILRTALDLHLDAIELRAICTEPGDYANQIEPSGQGGLKIAQAVARAVGALDDGYPSRVWGDTRPRA